MVFHLFVSITGQLVALLPRKHSTHCNQLSVAQYCDLENVSTGDGATSALQTFTSL